MLSKVYGTVTKNNLMWIANMVKERFNNANFKAKRSGCVYWHYGWREPVLYIPMYDNYIGGLIGLGKYLGWRHCDESNL